MNVLILILSFLCILLPVFFFSPFPPSYGFTLLNDSKAFSPWHYEGTKRITDHQHRRTAEANSWAINSTFTTTTHNQRWTRSLCSVRICISPICSELLSDMTCTKHLGMRKKRRKEKKKERKLKRSIMKGQEIEKRWALASSRNVWAMNEFKWQEN